MKHLLYVSFLILTTACGDEASVVDPSDPDRLSQVLVIPGARRVQGQPPPPGGGQGAAPQISGGSGISVTSGNQAVIDVEFESPSGYRNCYIQVEGAGDYFVIESEDDTNEGQLQIPVDVPSNVDTGSFRLYTCIAGSNGAVSNPISTSVSVTRPSGGGGGTDWDTCSPVQEAGACTIQYCIRVRNGGVGACAYTVNGQTIACGDCTDAGSLQACAQRAADVCSD